MSTSRLATQVSLGMKRVYPARADQSLLWHKAGRIYEAREAYSEALHLSPQAGEEGDEPSKERECPERVSVRPSASASF